MQTSVGAITPFVEGDFFEKKLVAFCKPDSFTISHQHLSRHANDFIDSNICRYRAHLIVACCLQLCQGHPTCMERHGGYVRRVILIEVLVHRVVALGRFWTKSFPNTCKNAHWLENQHP